MGLLSRLRSWFKAEATKPMKEHRCGTCGKLLYVGLGHTCYGMTADRVREIVREELYPPVL